MFDNIGGKIKTLATVIAIVGIIASVIIGFVLFFYGLSESAGLITLSGIAIMVMGSLGSWAGSFFMYGFGEIIENTQDLRDDIKSVKAQLKNLEQKNDGKNISEPKTETKATTSTHHWRCYKCHNMISKYPCEHCNFPENEN